MSGNTNTNYLTTNTLIYPERMDILQNQNKYNNVNVLLIDNTVPSYQTFVDSANSTTFPIVFSPECSAIELLQVLRIHFTEICRMGICFVSPGNTTVQFLDNGPLFTETDTTELYSKNVELIINIIREFSVKHIDFLACDTLTYVNWTNYYALLTQTTGVIVGASDNKTGNIKYGGDWIMESSAEDIEMVYFTQSIEYYSYLLDNLSWATLPNSVVGMTTDGINVYCGTNATPFPIYKINISTNTYETWVTKNTFTTNNPSGNPNGVWGLCISGNYIYVANNNTSTISKISLTSPTTDYVMNWATSTQGVASPAQLTIYGNYLYVKSAGGANITRISLINPATDYLKTWATSTTQRIRDVYSVTTYNGNLYSIAFDNGYLTRISIDNPTTNFSANIAVLNTGCLTGLLCLDNYLYASNQNSKTVARLNLNNYSDVSLSWKPPNSVTYGLISDGTNIYGAFGTTIRKLVIPFFPFSSLSFDLGNTYTVSNGNLKVSIIDASNRSDNEVYYLYSTAGGSDSTYINSNVLTNGPANTSFYIPNLLTDISYTVYVKASNSIGNSASINTSLIVYITPTTITNCSVSSVSIGNISISITESSPSTYYYLNGVSYWYYLYTTGTNLSANAAVYSNGVSMNPSYTTNFVVPNQPANNYRVYLLAKNSIGNTVATAFSANVTVLSLPLATVSLDTGNTKTIAGGNLQVRINDPSNVANNVYYWYSLNVNNDASYSNSFVKSGTTPYTFFIPSISDISNTLYVRASNTLGNSSPAANLQVIVYQTPRQPPQVTFQLVQSGNVLVSIIESASPPTPYYYLNNVSYYLYAYNNANGTNLSGNTSLLVYNKPVGILSNTDATYGNVVSYVNTGLTANTYTMYLIATNSFGNSIPYYANINVYTTPDYPPKIDIGNTISATDGNLTVSFTDSSNNTRNAISYWYYVYDSSTGTNNSGNISYYANSSTVLTTGAQQSFPLYGFTNKTYTLYLLSRNIVGYSNPIYSNVTVYTVPNDISIDTANVRIVSSGNLQVLLVDLFNGTNNGVYYQYSINGVNGNAYSNSNAQSIGANTYRFYISGLSNATYTINVVAKNTVGTSNANTFSQLSYVIPQYPPIIDQANTLSKTSGNLTVSFIDTSNIALNNITYTYYLYDISAGGTNYYANTAYYADSPIQLLDGTTQYSFPLVEFPNKAYTLYLRSKNTVGYSSNSISYNVTVFTTPTATVTFDSGNTKTVASGNLQVRLIDPSNVGLNNVYYWYSTTTDTNNAYSNSYVKTGVLPYTFYISTVDISNTVYVKATNPVGNSFPSASTQVVVYRTPRTPPQVVFRLVQSGNVQITITETSGSRPDYYYINNVSYICYPYINSSGANLSGNVSAYTSNIGILANTNTTYEDIVSYISTGLTANTYTMYVKAINPFGSSTPFVSANISVYTTPLAPTINKQTTVSSTAGNVTISFADTVNNPYNGIEYWYYMYGSTDGINHSGNIFAYTNSGKGISSPSFTFDIYGYANNTYTLYLLAKNPIGNSAPDSTNVVVYTIPESPSHYDYANIKTIASGNLQVSFIDTANQALNNIYYWYSVDNGTTYSNSFVKNTGTTNAYTFVISSLGNIRTNISLRATNPVGYSMPLTETFTVLHTPRSPPEVTTNLIQSGNVLLNIRESTIPPPENYDLNGVSYYYYLYTDGTGTNQSGNILSYTNFIGTIANSSYPDLSIYVTGLPNKTSTFYVIAQNAIGNSIPVSSVVTVYVVPDTPPAFDAGNTFSIASGNLQVRLIDTTNTSANNVYYWYSINGGNTYANTNIRNTGTTSYTFYVKDLSNQDYTVSVIAKNAVGYSTANTITKRVYTTPQFSPIIDTANTRSYSANQLQVTFNDTSNATTNNIRYWYYIYDKIESINQSGNIAYYTDTFAENYTFDISGLSNKTYTLYLLARNTVGTSTPDSANVIVYSIPESPTIDMANTLSVASGNVRVVVLDTSNSLLNSVYYWYSIDGGNTYSNTNVTNVNTELSWRLPYVFYVSGLTNSTYTLSVMAKNTVGNGVSAPRSIISYTTPYPVSFDAGNTKTVSSGNLRVGIIDTSNRLLNSVYYWYSIDGGNTYSNTNIQNVGPEGSPYVLYLPDLSNQTYTVSVKSVNSIDQSTASSITKTVYVTPQYSPVLDMGNTVSSTSGNLTVVFDDTNNRETNDIQYWYYLYDPSNTVNDWMNPTVYTNTNRTLTMGTTRFSFGLSTLTNKTYTLYLLSKNSIGTSTPVYANTIVYTTPANPPIIDIGNTRTAATGNLLVTFTDTINSSLNGIYYWYSTNGGSSYANSFVKNAGPGQTTYSMYISGLANTNTSLSIISKNTVGNSLPSTGVVRVYTIPLSGISIDTGNTRTVSSGNLQITFVDNQNIATNDIYYWYSTNGGSSYANSFVKNAGLSQTKYAFYINNLTRSTTSIAIKARNSTDLYMGESNATSANVIVYTIPESISSYSISSSMSGNIQITLVDTNNTYTNQVYYYVYYYRTGDTEPNHSANIAVYSNTYVNCRPDTTTSTFYLNGLSNNQYSVYVAAQNSVGSHLFSTVAPPIQVYTIPLTPAIDNANTTSRTSGNVTVSILDTVNQSTNSVYYWYSLDGNVYGNTGITTVTGVAQYVYDIPYTQVSNGNVYTIRIKTVNPVGQSPGVATSNPTAVFTTPEIPVIYTIVSQDTAIDITFSTPYNNGNTISRYEYILNDAITGIFDTTLGIPHNSATIRGLTNGNTYTVSIRAINARGPSGWSAQQTTMPFGAPLKPETVVVVPGDRMIDISFSTPYNNGNAIIQYEYSLYNGSSNWPTNPISLSYNNQYTVAGLTNGTTYEVVVRAINARGAGEWSVAKPATPFTTPSAPIVRVESMSAAFRIYFDTPDDGGAPITYYQYTLDNGVTYTQFGAVNSVIVSGTDGAAYTVRVRTWNMNGLVSGLSVPVTVVPFSAPGSPILQSADAGIGAIPITFSLSTTDGGNTITRYEYSTNNGDSFVSMGIPTTINGNGYITYEIIYQSTGLPGSSQLINGTAYTIRLRAVNARGPSTFSGSITATPFNRPDPPILVYAIPDNHVIDISFLAPANDGGNPITKYEYSIDGGNQYNMIEDIDIHSQQFHYTITGLENGNVFSVSLRSQNARGVSNRSNSIEAIPFGIPDPPIINAIPKNTRLEVSFDTPNWRGNAIVGYDYSVNSGVYKRILNMLPMNDMSQNTFTIYELINGRPYTIHMRTVNSVGISVISNIVEITPSTIPESPTIQTVVPLPSAIDVVFNTVANTGGNAITGYKYAYHLDGL